MSGLSHEVLNGCLMRSSESSAFMKGYRGRRGFAAFAEDYEVENWTIKKDWDKFDGSPRVIATLTNANAVLAVACDAGSALRWSSLGRSTTHRSF